MICEVFEDFILKVLIVAAIVSTVLGIIKDGIQHGYQEGLGIVFAIIIIVVVTVGNEYTKEKQFLELMSRGDEKMVKVFRAGNPKEISSEELVVGDLVQIAQGDTVPADCLAVEANDAFANESNLTGEPDDLVKEPVGESNILYHPDPFLLQGSLLQKGTVTALVLAVGDDTMQGKAGLSMNITNSQTPLQAKLDRIANGIGMLGTWVAGLTFLVICISTMIRTFKNDEKSFDMDFWADIMNGLVIAITVIVVAVPEGLPLAVTISLAFSVSKMYDENNLVRKLQSSETMGNANEICTDKTGTLTMNQMSVQAAFFENEVNSYIDKHPNFSGLSSHEMIADAILFNSTAFMDVEERENDRGVKQQVEVAKGNATEVGLLKYLDASGVDTKAKINLRRQNEPVFEIPFNSERKRATTVVATENGYRVFCKGAPEIVIKMCTGMLAQGGQLVDLNNNHVDNIIGNVIPTWASQCLRTMLISYADLSADEFEALKAANNNFRTSEDQAAVEKNLIMVGIFGLKDPLRPDIKKNVELCQAAGINVRMVTGDNIDTAKAISLEAGILKPEDLEDAED